MIRIVDVSGEDNETGLYFSKKIQSETNRR